MDNINIPFEDNPNPMFVYHTNTLHIEEVNRAALDLYGYTYREMTSLTIKDLIDPEDVSRAMEQVKKQKQNQEIPPDTNTWKHHHKNGRTIYVRAIGSSVKYNGKICRLATLQNITKQYELETELKVEKNILDHVLQKLPGAFYIVNQNGNLLRWNDQLENITGYDSRELRNETVFNFFPEEELPKIQQALKRGFLEGQSHTEAVIRHKDGQETPFYFVASKMHYHDRECLVGISLDISDIKEYEYRLEKSLEERETLLSEIHHRVKNNLAVISGIMELQLLESEDEKLRQALLENQSRIKSIAITHELLYQEQSLSRVDYRANIRNLVQNLTNSFHSNATFNLDLDEVYLNINKALPASLLVNELLTNILEHAFSDTETGEISIQLNEQDKEIHLKVEDNGKGLPDDFHLETSGSLGMRLVNLLAKQLEADLHLHSSEEGTRFDVNFENRKIKGTGNAFM